mmetsp:Transcript_29344/g.40541  ORF Transcript_29344/g.40541 Transcript_29344/m.40541 type:complete len:225 (+) Transcript_29344:341-1015(+)
MHGSECTPACPRNGAPNNTLSSCPPSNWRPGGRQAVRSPRGLPGGTRRSKQATGEVIRASSSSRPATQPGFAWTSASNSGRCIRARTEDAIMPVLVSCPAAIIRSMLGASWSRGRVPFSAAARRQERTEAGGPGGREDRSSSNSEMACKATSHRCWRVPLWPPNTSSTASPQLLNCAEHSKGSPRRARIVSIGIGSASTATRSHVRVRLHPPADGDPAADAPTA